MKAELIKHEQTDLSVSNIARVSFGNWNDTFNKEKDTRLIYYLARNKHISPFFHQRFAFKNLNLDFKAILEDESLRIGFLCGHVFGEGYISQHSFYGWTQLITRGLFTSADEQESVTAALVEKMPVSSEAYGLLAFLPKVDRLVETVDDYTLPDKFKTVTMRLTMPIFVARQMFTHRRFATNEISRRYVDSDPEFYVPESWRGRPEGSIKQGSAGVVGEICNLKVDDLPRYCIEESYDIVKDEALNLYKSMIHSGVAPEQARMVLPQSMYTQAIFTHSLEAWKSMLKLRLSSHTQRETRDLAIMIEKELEKV